MENLTIEAREDFFSLGIFLEVSSGLCEITGESYVEDAQDFYSPVIDWIRTHAKENGNGLSFDFKLNYLNTSSYKEILNIITVLKEYKDQQEKVEINWYYPEDDLDMLAEAEDLAETAKVRMNLIPYQLDY